MCYVYVIYDKLYLYKPIRLLMCYVYVIYDKL